MASRCRTTFVEPPIACRPRTAFANAASVSSCDGRTSSRTIATMRSPVATAAAARAGSEAGIAAVPGSISPSSSVTIAMLEAVPIVLHAPRPHARQASKAAQSASLIAPVRWLSQARHRSVPVPTRRPFQCDTGRGPAVSTSAGRSALVAPMIALGTDLSQLASSTTPSSG